jgi:pimeloyl-ACP methyl ester carboxylesterase
MGCEVFAIDKGDEMSEQRVSRRAAIAGAGAMAGLGLVSINRSTAQAANKESAMQATPVSTTPTVVLVHGAFADASGWAGVITSLQASGINVLAVANPLRGVTIDATYVAAVANAIPGPVLLVGHSYGGVVITNAGTQVKNAVGLVYISAFAPDEGETLQKLAEAGGDTPFSQSLRPLNVPISGVPDLVPEFSIDPAAFHDVFCADLPDELAATMALSQRPISALCFAEPTGVPAWKSLPSWFAVGTQDVTIGADPERFFAQRAGSTTVEIDGSHVIMISQPEAVSDLIRSAVESVS